MPTLPNLLLERDYRYDYLFSHTIHIISYIFEYCIIPLFLFVMIYHIVRKENRSSDYFGYSILSEVTARNWLELSITFSVTWMTFEASLALDLAIRYHSLREVFTPCSLVIPPLIFSLFLFLLHVIFSFLVFKRTETVNGEFSDTAEEIVVSNAKRSLISYLILFQLLIALSCYPFLYLRFFLSVLFWILLFACRNKIPYTSSYWWNKAQRAKPDRNNNDTNRLYLVLHFLSNTYALRGRSESNRRPDDLHEIASILKRIHSKQTERREEKFLAALARYKRIAMRSRNSDVYDTLNELSS